MSNQFWTINTDHLTKGTFELLTRITQEERTVAGWPWMKIGVYPSGLFLTIPYKPELRDLHAMPADLVAVIALANNQGVGVVLFDPLADRLVDLPSYEW